MIIIRLLGGLGNQMFHYALSTVLKEHYQTEEVYFDSSLYRVLCEHNGLEINRVFNIDYKEASDRKIKEVSGRSPYSKAFCLIPMPFKKWVSSLPDTKKNTNRSSICIKQRYSDQWIEHLYKLDMKKNYYLDGNWQNYRYYERYEKELQSIFVYQNNLKRSLVQRYPALLSNNSVSLHIRRGDYITHKTIKFDLCKLSYYKAAIDIIERKIKNPHFYIFTDDFAYAHQQFSFLSNKTFVKDNPNSIDLQLMSLCKHNIIANSTFSFWGAFLNKNKNKIVIAPKFLKIDDMNKVPFPASSDWIVLDNLKKL